jgi:transcriptional regulator of met regulon
MNTLSTLGPTHLLNEPFSLRSTVTVCTDQSCISKVMRQVLHAYYLQPLPVQAQARSERVNNNIGQKKKMQRLASWMVCQTFGQTH